MTVVLRVLLSVILSVVAANVVAATPSATDGIALSSDGTVFSWGGNYHGTIGNGTTTPRYTPGRISGLPTISGVSLGGHALAIQNGGLKLWSWGLNESGQLGLGYTSNYPYSSVLKPALMNANWPSAIAVASTGGAHSLVLVSGGSVYAFGANGDGQLGLGDFVSRNTPVVIPGLPAITAVSAGSSHSLALTSAGTVYSWGWNFTGELGYGAVGLQDGHPTPTLIPGLNNVVAVSAGTSSMALKSDGTVWTWGAGTSSPSQAPGLSNVIAISAGHYYALALRSDGTVWGWEPSDVDLGWAPRYVVPTQVPGLANATSISAGGGNGFAILQNGSVWAWGDNTDGSLGTGSKGGAIYPPIQIGLWLTPQPTPVNDNFAAGTVMSGLAWRAGGYNYNATAQSGEPNHAGIPASKSVWWKWTAPSSGQVTLNATGSSFMPALEVYTGTQLNNLASVVASTAGSVLFQALAGQTYDIVADGYSTTGDGIVLSLNTNTSASADVGVSVSPANGSSAPVGSPLNINVIVNNAGPQTAVNTDFTLDLPSNPSWIFQSAPSYCTNSGTNIICKLGDLASGSSMQTSISIQPQSTGDTSLSLTASSNTSDPNLANNIVSNALHFIPAPPPPPPNEANSDSDVPTLPEWGVIVMGLLLLTISMSNGRRGRF